MPVSSRFGPRPASGRPRVCVAQAEPDEQPVTPGGGEAGLPEQCVPSLEPVWVVRTAESAVGVAQDVRRTVDHLQVCVAPAYPSVLLEGTLASEIVSVLSAVAMRGTVVLMEGA